MYMSKLSNAKGVFVSVVVGIIYVFLAIQIIGIGAAIAIPTRFFEHHPLIALRLADLVTLGLPLMFLYVVLVKLVSQVDDSPFGPVLLCVPFFAYTVYQHILHSEWYGSVFAWSTYITFVPLLMAAFLNYRTRLKAESN